MVYGRHREPIRPDRSHPSRTDHDLCRAQGPKVRRLSAGGSRIRTLGLPSTVSSVHPGARHVPRFAECAEANNRQYAEAWGGFHMRQSRPRAQDRLRRLEHLAASLFDLRPARLGALLARRWRRRFLLWHLLSASRRMRRSTAGYDPYSSSVASLAPSTSAASLAQTSCG